MRIFYILLFPLLLLANNCSPYFNPDKFFKGPEYLDNLLKDIDIEKKLHFTIEEKELYRYTSIDIAMQINENFQDHYEDDGYWRDWKEDAYEMRLVPEQILFQYKKFYLSLHVIIEGVIGDATKLKGTVVKYNFYNYTKQVNKHIECKKGKL